MFVLCVDQVRQRAAVAEPLKTGRRFLQPPPPKQLVFCSFCWFPRSGRRHHFLASLPPQDWPFDDGAPPSNQIVDDWLNLLKLKFREEPGCCVAVHCVAGLGR